MWFIAASLGIRTLYCFSGIIGTECPTILDSKWLVCHPLQKTTASHGKDLLFDPPYPERTKVMFPDLDFSRDVISQSRLKFTFGNFKRC